MSTLFSFGLKRKTSETPVEVIVRYVINCTVCAGTRTGYVRTYSSTRMARARTQSSHLTRLSPRRELLHQLLDSTSCTAGWSISLLYKRDLYEKKILISHSYKVHPLKLSEVHGLSLEVASRDEEREEVVPVTLVRQSEERDGDVLTPILGKEVSAM